MGDGLQQQQTTSDSILISQEHKSETTVGTDAPKWIVEGKGHLVFLQSSPLWIQCTCVHCGLIG